MSEYKIPYFNGANQILLPEDPSTNNSATRKSYVDQEVKKVSEECSKKLPLTGGSLTGVLNSQSIIPSSNDSYDLGSSSNKFRNIYASQSVSAQTISASMGNFDNINSSLDTKFPKSGGEISGSITPSSHASYDLGSSSNRFRNLYLSGSVNASTVNATTVSATSDARLKENIKPLSIDSEKILSALNLCEFNFIADTNKTKYIGLLAQELQRVVPKDLQNCFISKVGDTLAINETKLIYLLIDQVNKLTEQIKELRGNV